LLGIAPGGAGPQSRDRAARSQRCAAIDGKQILFDRFRENSDVVSIDLLR